MTRNVLTCRRTFQNALVILTQRYEEHITDLSRWIERDGAPTQDGASTEDGASTQHGASTEDGASTQDRVGQAFANRLPITSGWIILRQKDPNDTKMN